MTLRFKLLRFLLPIIIVGYFCDAVKTFAIDENPEKSQNKTKELNSEQYLVEVEPTHIVSSSVSGQYQLVPYKIRRSRWGSTFSVGYSNYSPNNFVGQFAFKFDEVFGPPTSPLVELQLSIKRNFSFASVALDIAGGIMSATSSEPFAEETLETTILRSGLRLNLDMLFYEPYIVPYLGGGVYMTLYKSTLEATSNNGNTQVAPYFSGGLLFQLDWMDKVSARQSYEESGIEGTYIFVEVRQFAASSLEADPDFSSLHLASGLALEF